MKRLAATVLCAALLAGPGSRAAAQEFDPAHGLAVEFMRAAQLRMMVDAPSMQVIDASLMLAQEAVALAPQDPQMWRITLSLARLAEREALRDQAIERLAQLDPGDELVRLLQLGGAIEKRQTVEQRIAGYEHLLADDSVERIGRPVAARLALDLALLHQRRGDMESFARWLARALSLDSSLRSAAALATGFYRINVQDAFGEAELLTSLMLADPTDVLTQCALAQLLLENGAYTAAERIYRLAMRGFAAARVLPSHELLADYAIAQWARGDHRGALETIRLRQADLDASVRTQARQKALENHEPDPSMLELAHMSAPAEPILAAVRAVILFGRDDPDAAEAREAALGAYQARIDAMGGAAAGAAGQPSAQHIAALRLEMAWLALWLGAEADRVSELLAQAQSVEPLSEQAQARFDGWLALRRGELDIALQRLAPLAPADPIARLGLALAHLKQSDQRQAARELLQVTRAQPGSLIGIWSAWKLAELLGQNVPVSEVAGKLEKLISSIPGQFDRYPEDPSLALSLRVVPAKLNYEPYEPILVDVELVNTSFLPLALDRDGPIRPQVLIAPTVRASGEPGSGELRPFIVDLSSRMRLAPREKLTVRFDARNYLPGAVLNEVAAKGAIVRFPAHLNFVVSPQGSIETGLYGVRSEPPMVRVDGARVGGDWLERTTTAIVQDPRHQIVPMALMSHVIAPILPREVTIEQARRIESARAAFAEAFGRLDPVSQAWILAVMQPGEGMAQVLSIARQSPSRLVLIAYLLGNISGQEDPMLDAARRSDDPVLRQLGELIFSDLQAAQQPVRR